jgi:peptidoglycan/xylan/chitin deacetylase (PgdA/CDA1 family)
MYHGIGRPPTAEAHPGEARYWVDRDRFGEQLRQIGDAGHRATLLFELWLRRSPWREPAHPIVLTFDDGRASHYEAAFPLLARTRLRAEFFVNTATIGRAGFLTWSQVAAMQRGGQSFQSHSHDHVVLRGLPRPLVERQVQVSKRILEDRLGQRVDFLAAPYGLLDRQAIEVAQEAGYRAVCTSWPWPATVGAATVNRIAVYSDTTARRLESILAGRRAAYLPAAARAAVVDVPKRALLRIRPAALGVGLLQERV